MTSPDPSLIDMTRELKQMAVKVEKPSCAICTPDYTCYWCRSFAERTHQREE